MHLKSLTFIILILLLLVSPVSGVKVTVHPSGGDSDQTVINEAFEKVAQMGGGEVYLEGEKGNNVFTVTGTCKFESDNTKLTGNSNTILSVSPKSSQWFTGTDSIIYSGGYSNIEISGFQIDGNCEQMDFDFHHSRSDTAHDCERAIIISGSSSNFCKSISVHDLTIYDCFSDGMNIRFAENVHIYNNKISNCQHEGIFLVSVINGLTESNSIAGITSDCARLDNVVNNIFQYNYCYSYTGSHNSQAPKGEQNGIQIANAGSSHGYDASNKPTSTTNVEVRYNTFVNTGDKAVWLDSTGKGYDNVYVHDNNYSGVNEFTNNGEPVIITGIDPSKPISYENPPSKETSEKIFHSLWDIFNQNFYTQVEDNETVILPDGVDKTPSKVLGKVEYYKIGDNYTTFVKIPTEGLTEVQYEVNGKKATHTLMIGEKTSNGVVFTETSIWEGELQHTENALKLDGKVPMKNINVVCITPKDSTIPILETSSEEFKMAKFHPAAIGLLLVFILGCLFIRFSINHMV